MAGAMLPEPVGHGACDHWNALVGSGLLRLKANGISKASLRDLHAQVVRGRPRAGLQLAPREVRSVRAIALRSSAHRSPASLSIPNTSISRSIATRCSNP